MSRILDYVLEPSVVYTNGSFLVKVKVQDDYKYKKLLVSENMKYTTATGTTYTLTNAVSSNNASILQLEGNTTQNGTPTPSSPVEVKTVSGDNEVVVKNKNFCSMNRTTPLGNFTTSNNAATHSVDIENRIVTVTPNTSSTGANKGIYWQINTDYYKNLIANKNAVISFDLRADSNCIIRTNLESGQGSIVVDRNVTTEWQRFELSFNRPLASWTAFTFYEREGTDAVFYIRNIQVEQNTQATSFEPHRIDSYRVDFGGKNEFTGDVTSVTNGSYSEGVVTGTAVNCFVYFNNNTISVKSGETIYFSADIRLTSGSTGVFNALNDASNVNTKVVYPTLNTTFQRYQTKLTYSSDFTINRLLFQTGSFSGSVEIKNIMISKSADILYSPHVSNPIELCKIGSYVDKLKRAEGKQLFNYTSQTDDGWYSDIPNFINDTGTYTISINNKSLTGNWAVYFINSSKQRVGEWIKASSSVSTPSTFTVTTEQANAPYIRILPNASGLHDIENYNIMVNEGSTALPYEPYGTDWYIEKNIGKVVLNENSNIVKYDNNGRYYISGILAKKGSTTSPNAMSNYFNGVFAIGNGNIFSSGVDGTINMINTSYLNDLAGFKTWLGTTTPIVYYVKATPTYEIIDNEYLLQQLNNLQDMQLVENLCYVDWVGEEKPTMTLQYPTNETLNAYITTEDNKLIRTDWGV